MGGPRAERGSVPSAPVTLQTTGLPHGHFILKAGHLSPGT